VVVFVVAVWHSGNGEPKAVAVLFGWEGSRKSGIAMAMCHRLCGIFIYG